MPTSAPPVARGSRLDPIRRFLVLKPVISILRYIKFEVSLLPRAGGTEPELYEHRTGPVLLRAGTWFTR